LNEGLGGRPLPAARGAKIRRSASLAQPVRAMAKAVLGRFRPLVMKVYARNPVAKRVIKHVELSLKTTPTPSELALYGRSVVFANAEAKRVLGTGPATSIEEGLRLSVAWMQHHGFAPTGHR